MPQRRLRAAVLVAWLWLQDISERQDALERQVGRVPGNEVWVSTVLHLPPIPFSHLRSRTYPGADFWRRRGSKAVGRCTSCSGETLAPSSLAGAACRIPPLALRWCHSVLGYSPSPSWNKLKWDFSKAHAKASKQVPAPVKEEQINDVRQTAGIIAAGLAPMGC